MENQGIPPGFCGCGCGLRTSIATSTKRRIGRIKGQPIRFVHGHNARLGHPERIVEPAARFWPKVDVRGPDECWIWKGGYSGSGYGQFRIRKGRMIGAHRFALELVAGPLADDVMACHECDNRACVNPAHLFPGTNSDNIKDAVAKGRASMGVGVPNAKLTDDAVREARRLAAGGMYQRDIAAKLGVSQYAIWCVLSGRSWKHVAGDQLSVEKT